MSPRVKCGRIFSTVNRRHYMGWASRRHTHETRDSSHSALSQTPQTQHNNQIALCNTATIPSSDEPFRKHQPCQLAISPPHRQPVAPTDNTQQPTHNDSSSNSITIVSSCTSDHCLPPASARQTVSATTLAPLKPVLYCPASPISNNFAAIDLPSTTL